MSVRLSSLRERLREASLLGTFVKLPALEAIEICAQTLDFAVVDLEHSQLTEDDALRLVRHAWALGFPALVRLPEVDRGLVNRLLEAGAAGIQLSSVRRSPRGRRGPPAASRGRALLRVRKLPCDLLPRWDGGAALAARLTM